MRLARPLLAMLCAAAAAARAQPPAPPAFSGSRDVLTVSDCAAPVPLRFIAARPPLAIRTGDVAPRPAAPPPAWTLDWDRPTPSDPAINEYAATGHFRDGCPTPGLYGIPLTVFADGGDTTALSLSLVKVAEPAIDVPGTLALAAEHWWLTSPAPVGFAVRQPVPGAPDLHLTVLGGELRTAGGDPTGISLEPTPGPITIKPGTAARIALQPSGILPPGAYTARLTLQGDRPSQSAVVDVAYKLRLTPLILLLVLALGAAIGAALNHRLSRRAALEAALVDGMRAMQALMRRANPQRDPAVQQRLLAVANLLQSNLEDARTPAEVTAQVLEAEGQAKEIEGRAYETTVGLQQSLAGARAALRPSGREPDDMVASRLGSLLGEIEALQRTAEAGDVEGTSARLQDFTRDLPGRLTPPIQAFLSDVQAELAALGTLPPGAELDAARTSLDARIKAAYSLAEPSLLIEAADSVARQVRSWMDLSLPGTLADQWRIAARILADRPALTQRLLLAAEQADELRRTSRDPLSRLGALAALVKGVKASLADAGSGERRVAEALAAGDVVLAARALTGQPAPTGRDAGSRVATITPKGPPALPTTPPSAVLRVKPLVALGQDSMVTVRWLGERPANDRIRWRCHPEDSVTLLPVQAGAILRPKQAGFVMVFLDVDDTRLAEARTYAGEVTEQSFYPVVSRRGRAVSWVGGLVAGLLTVLAGYEIIGPGWLGSSGDTLGAFLFGFIGQFGLDRLRELAQPLLPKTA